MSVRKRRWKSPSGEMKEAWVVDYVDQHGDRHLKTFARRKDAEAWRGDVAVEVKTGIHIADSRSITIAEAGRKWIERCEAADLERTTLAAYAQQLKLHIAPLIGNVKLAQLTAPMVRRFEDRLGHDGRSPAMVRKVMCSLGSILGDAQERGLVAQNVAYNLSRARRYKGRLAAKRRRKPRLRVGVDIPTPSEVRAIIGKLEGRWRPVLLTAIFTGLRSSELRGLKWEDIDLGHSELHVRQRADRYGKIGRTKSEAGERTVPLPPMLISALREHKLACPKGELGLAFPHSQGGIDQRSSIVYRGFRPAQVAAGVVDRHGRAKYGGLHSLRHFYASWCINRRVDGGLELPLKVVQARLGHASIQMTADTYGHLFPRSDDGAELAAAERAFLAG